MRYAQRSRTKNICLVGLICGVFAFALPICAQRRTGAGRPGSFETLAKRADEARAVNRLDDAIELYRQALALRPRWGEGWWYLATLLYERDRYAEAARAFQKAAELQPKAGAPWALLGLCEFQLGRYDEALLHIQRGRQLGLVNNPELIRVLRYHEALLLLLKGDFETAQQNLGALAYDGVSSEDLILALGLAILRIPALPRQIPPNSEEHELIRRAGWAELQAAQRNFTDAHREYARLAADYGKAPNVQYAYGRYLLSRRDDEGALAAFQREIENSPENALARLQIAYIKLRNKEAAAGLKFAEEAIRLYPRSPLGHYLLGRLLLDVGQVARAIEELEVARNLAPEEPRIHFALARAYARANRKADAERARETFVLLNKKAEEAANRGLNRGEVIQDEKTDSNAPR